MNFDFSDDQKYLKEQARKFLSEQSSMAVVRTILNDDTKSHDAKLWQAIADMGWLGAAIPEAYGGLGLGELELCVLAEEMGRSLAPVPWASTVYFFAEALKIAGSEAQKQALLPGVADGSVIGCVAASEGPGEPRAAHLTTRFDGSSVSGTKLPVADGDCATHALVLVRDETCGGAASLVIVDLRGAGVSAKSVKTFDPTRSHASITFDKAPAHVLGEAGDGEALLSRIYDRAAVLVSFEQIGGSQACLEMATDYAKGRYAFSRQIGSFQAIKHKLADMYVALEIARSNAYYGAWALSTDAPELPLAAAAARIAGCEAYYLASKENIQTHGGMGFTWEVDCHLYYRRAKLLALQAGAPALWKEKLVRRLELRNAA
ncbi:acyl-CoA dehydrogenase [Candidatus Phycosocius bacilliformis]|uniref:Acyl-CoA dehydrogenase n=1 Tax=Candidatus Phycosocius bacilliformis TaxID=1445552 RepID=A0A2P2E8D4_9PROT|nr:acyl-CoA dehydrogenase family protein [Candidatus Phycosocius bacilliformis]GBF57294.1 acyl-CoA dehydrogenase [Candidatus Phycosocius bacilliformis]